MSDDFGTTMFTIRKSFSLVNNVMLCNNIRMLPYVVDDDDDDEDEPLICISRQSKKKEKKLKSRTKLLGRPILLTNTHSICL
ncbi:hypothetical protein DERF_009564 [Dermatophagoides farinae]|uniref:Uncharacterized protein n=1 Tax=Dermatophagoides farinae TaxID=6954 RepID=A0A922HX75_DERFA|nr:hypothetical protein DERF_009564 [Dermatophagoides farinae]